MEVSTEAAISLLTINLIVLSVVIVAMIVAIIVLAMKLNKIAKDIKQTTSNVSSITEWFSPMKVFSELARVISSFKKR